MKTRSDPFLEAWQKLRAYRLPSTATAPFCPSEVRGSVNVPGDAAFWKKLSAYAGAGLMVAIGYMDPGNWATDIEAGSRFGYGLLSIILLSSAIAMLLQSLCVRVGVASGRDLAMLCRERFPRGLNLSLWFLAELAIIACDLAEVLGTALAFKLLLGISLSTGVFLTALDTVIVLALQGAGIKRVESIVLGFALTVALCYGIELALVRPHWASVMSGFVPDRGVFSSPSAWYIAIGILGATVMPHNLYLHTSLVQTRDLERTEQQRSEAIQLGNWDTMLSLSLAFLVNVAILVLASAVFHQSGHTEVTEIQDAHRLLEPLLGTSVASILFAIALLAAGQSSTLTGTIAGQVVMEGFLKLKIPCWQRRLITRSLAIIPAWIGILWLGDQGVGRMLVWSQVALSLQLPFAVVPLILFSADPELMGKWKASVPLRAASWAACGLIIAANGWFVIQFARA